MSQTCLWVPANIVHEEGEKQSHLVYGGVNIQSRIVLFGRNDFQRNALINRAFTGANTARAPASYINTARQNNIQARGNYPAQQRMMTAYQTRSTGGGTSAAGGGSGSGGVGSRPGGGGFRGGGNNNNNNNNGGKGPKGYGYEPVHSVNPQNSQAQNVKTKELLERKLRAVENAKNDAVRTEHLSDGRVRYYNQEKAAEKFGPTRGTAHVTEYNSKTGQVRIWMESRDHQGNVNRVHPKMIDGQIIKSLHYPHTGNELKSK